VLRSKKVDQSGGPNRSQNARSGRLTTIVFIPFGGSKKEIKRNIVLTATEELSQLLLDLAGGKYDPEIAVARKMLSTLAPVWPPAEGVLLIGLDAFLALN
jgi:hypothetical protein